jgi:hypothetical protein
LAWKDLLNAHAPLVLPAAHDALTARLIERAGLLAYWIGGFALVGAESTSSISARSGCGWSRAGGPIGWVKHLAGQD